MEPNRTYDYSSIPEGLAQRKQWVCWRMESRDGKTTKIPYCPSTGMRASSADASTWDSFERAVNALDKGVYNGIGFVFAEDKAITGIDLDHVLHGGAIDERVRWIVEQANTYCEISPSGDGLHLFLIGQKPEGFNSCKVNFSNDESGNNVAAIEVYDHSRYFTVTGCAFGDLKSLNANAGVLERIYETFWERPKADQLPLAIPSDIESAPLSDDEVIEKMIASKNGPSIKALLDGDTSAYAGDDSAADMALCNHLAFYCGCDADQMDRIFRATGLMRPKWDEQHGSLTYGEMTIQEAVSSCTAVYQPNGPALSLPGSDAGFSVPFCLDKWRLDSSYFLWKLDKNKKWVPVTNTPPLVVANVRDIDSGIVRSLVQIPLNGSMLRIPIDRSKLNSTTEIVKELSPLGANITSVNSRDVVAFITDMENASTGSRKQVSSVSHLGWADRSFSRFMPYDQDDEFRFDPDADFAGKAVPFLEPAGSFEEWSSYIGRVRDRSQATRALIAASFASPLVAILSVQACMVYLWGMSRSGKTPSLKAAASVWGDPNERTNSYCRTFSDTPKALIRAAAFLHDLPLAVDELQSKGAFGGQEGKRKAVEDLIYSLSLGHEREGLNSNRSIMQSGSWRSITIATGEIPIIGSNTQQGAANRTLEINAEPFDDPQEARGLHHFLLSNYGTAGKVYISKLKELGTDRLMSRWAEFRERCANVVKNSPHAELILLLGFADALASLIVFQEASDWDKAVLNSCTLMEWLSDNTPSFEDGNTDLKAIQFISGWLYQNHSYFERESGPNSYCMPQPLGFVEHKNGERICFVLSEKIEGALNDAGYDRAKTLRRMSQEGLLAIPEGHRGFTVQRRRWELKPQFVPIRLEALADFLSESDVLNKLPQVETAVKTLNPTDIRRIL